MRHNISRTQGEGLAGRIVGRGTAMPAGHRDAGRAIGERGKVCVTAGLVPGCVGESARDEAFALKLPLMYFFLGLNSESAAL